MDSLIDRFHGVLKLAPVLICAALAFAQTALPPANVGPADVAAAPRNAASALFPDSGLPESGTIAPHEYRNPFYGFAFDFPDASETTLLRTRLMPRGVHGLLAVIFQNHQFSTEVSINAFDSLSGHALDPLTAANVVAYGIAGKRSSLRFEPLDIHPEKSGSLYYVEQHKYADKRIILEVFFSRRGHLVHLAASSSLPDQERFKAWLLRAIRFEAFDTLGESQPYFGPTVPDEVIEETIAKKPGRKLPAAAKFDGSFWVNTSEGVRHRLPRGWKALDLSTFDSTRLFQVQASEAQLATREHEFLNACSKPLLRLAGPKSGASQNFTPSMSLFAVDPQCLQIPFPKPDDAHSSAQFAHLLLAYPDFGDVRSSEQTNIAGHPFFVVRSLLPDKTVTDGLRRRLTQAAYVTELNGKMLMWFFIARTESEIPQFDSETMEFVPAK